ncbi:MAG: DUF2169 domain-containing protein [Polyangiaceae bacterium]|nr:DUF2169 domain-containing protein [Polyangiaceae bacterium]
MESSAALAVTTLPWQDAAGRVWVTVVAKVTLALRPDAVAELAAPEAIRRQDERGEDGRMLWPSDLVPYKAEADLVVRARAHAPAGGARRRAVAIALARGTELLLEHRFVVRGEREARAGDAGEPRRFTALPLDCGPRELAPETARLLAAERVVLPEDFDFRALQRALPELGAPLLAGGEQLLFEGLGAGAPVVRFRLPALGVAAVVAVRRAGREAHVARAPVAMACDTLCIDVERLVATQSWRGVCPLERGEEAGLAEAALVPLRAVEEVLGAPRGWLVEQAPPGDARRGRARPALENRSPFPATSFAAELEPGRAREIVVVKGSFALEPGAAATLAPVQDALCGDERWDGAEGASLRYASDHAPFKPEADVLAVGYAYPPPGANVARVALEVGSIDKVVVATGDRHWVSVAQPSDPAPFERMPLRHERAFGGPSSGDNPVGVGAGAVKGTALPNLERPEALLRRAGEAPRPACFAPLAPEWPARAPRSGTFDAAWQKTRWPQLPRDFDWTHFQAAPVDQRCAYLEGGESYRITSVLPGGAALEGRLPRARPRAFVLRRPAEPAREASRRPDDAPPATCTDHALEEVRLALDTVLFDCDAREARLVWRGSAPTADLGASDVERLLVVLDDGAGASDREQAWGELLVAGSRRFEPSELDAAGARRATLAALPRDPVRLREAAVKARRVAERQAALPALPASEPAPPEPVPRATIEAELRAGVSLAARDLTGAELAGLDFSGRDLTRAVFARATLTGARFDGARCAGVSLAGARAAGSSWVGAELARADAAGAELAHADLTKARLGQALLCGANLEGATLAGADLGRADLTKARLAGVRAEGASFVAADLSGATLDGAGLAGAVLDDARLYEASGEAVVLERASLADARLERARLPGVSLRDARAPGSVWEGADLSGAHAERANLAGAVLRDARLDRATFDEANLSDAVAAGASLREASLRRANLARVDLEGADCRGAELGGASLYQAETWQARLEGARLDEAFVAGSKLAKG